MAPPIMVGMITIMICQLIDLYFVSGLGDAAVAGVAAAGNAGFLVNGLMQVLGVGTVALIAHAVGRKDRADANLIFNQSIMLSVLFGMSDIRRGRSRCRAPTCMRLLRTKPRSKPVPFTCCGSCRRSRCNSRPR